MNTYVYTKRGKETVPAIVVVGGPVSMLLGHGESVWVSEKERDEQI